MLDKQKDEHRLRVIKKMNLQVFQNRTLNSPLQLLRLSNEAILFTY